MDQGGVERGTLDMALYTAAQGWTSLVASQGGRMVPELLRGGARHFQLPLKRRNPVAILYNAWKLVHIIRKYRVTLLHTRSRGPAWATLFASYITKVPFVTSFHGTHKIQNSLKRLYNSVMTRGVLTIANSEFIQQHIINNYHLPKDRLRLAHRGFDPDVFNPDMATKRERDKLIQQYALDNSPILIMPGRLTRWKGQIDFIEALALIKDIPWQALIVGGSDRKVNYEAELRTLVHQRGLDKRVFLTGSQDNLAPYYDLADITISASREPEAFGRVAVESQAMGTPVIATAHGGSLETVNDGETGWLVPPKSAKAMAETLRYALADSARRASMGKTAHRWVHSRFTVQNMCAREFSVYKEILDVIK